MCPSLSPKDRYPSWILVPHFVLCRNGCQRTGGPNSHKRTCAGYKVPVTGSAGHLGHIKKFDSHSLINYDFKLGYSACSFCKSIIAKIRNYVRLLQIHFKLPLCYYIQYVLMMAHVTCRVE
jgi:hypothetical protein